MPYYSHMPFTRLKNKSLHLKLTIPIYGAPITITFITFIDENGEIDTVETYQYNTISDGVRREYKMQMNYKCMAIKASLIKQTSYFNVLY